TVLGPVRGLRLRRTRAVPRRGRATEPRVRQDRKGQTPTSTQHDDAGQVGLFPTPDRPPQRHRPARLVPRAPQMLSMKPHVAREVLAEVAEGRFGIVDNTDRVARIRAEDSSISPAAE